MFAFVPVRISDNSGFPSDTSNYTDQAIQQFMAGIQCLGQNQLNIAVGVGIDDSDQI